jgi:diadenylate cyclase
MRAFLADYWNSLPPIPVTAVLDVLLVAALLYQVLALVRGRRAANVLGGIFFLALGYGLSVAADLVLLRSILETLAPYTAFALIVMFHSEIRRGLARIGVRRWQGFGMRLQDREAADEIILAVQQLAQTATGALIVIERDIGLRTFVESGVRVDADVSRDLLLAIFQKGGALHDGAVIIQGNRLAAAACFLPLTMKPDLSRQFGTRHRAGIGVTEEADCIAIIVSEETGRIGLAARGELERDVTLERLGQRLGRQVTYKMLAAGHSSTEAPRL